LAAEGVPSAAGNCSRAPCAKQIQQKRGGDLRASCKQDGVDPVSRRPPSCLYRSDITRSNAFTAHRNFERRRRMRAARALRNRHRHKLISGRREAPAASKHRSCGEGNSEVSVRLTKTTLCRATRDCQARFVGVFFRAAQTLKVHLDETPLARTPRSGPRRRPALKRRYIVILWERMNAPFALRETVAAVQAGRV
jgi:hypothetical protein